MLEETRVIGSYSSTNSLFLNPRSKIKTDDDGWTELILGGFNIANFNGNFYFFNPTVEEIFTKANSTIRRKVDNGLLISELEHPDFAESTVDGKTLAEKKEMYLRRIFTLDSRNECNSIKSWRLSECKDEFNKPFIAVIGKIKPSGVKKQAVIDKLADPEQNIAYSVRCIYRDVMLNGKSGRLVSDVITYDKVAEGGITPATKYGTMGLEGINRNTINFTDADVRNAQLEIKRMGLENTMSLERLVKDDKAWRKIEIKSPFEYNAFDWG